MSSLPPRSVPALPRRTGIVAALLVVATAAPAGVAGTSIGSLDPGFGDAGAIRIGNPDGDTSVTADLHALNDGRLVLLLPGDPTTVLRFLADGSPDPAFGGDGRVTIGATLRVDALTVDANGRTLLVGSRAGPGEDHDVAIARLLPGGGLDPDYGTNGVTHLARPGFSERGCGAAIDGAGRLVVAAAGVDDRGTRDPDDDRTVATFLQLGNRGRLHDAFGGDGIVRIASTAARCDLYPQTDGSIVFGGPPEGPRWFGSRCAVGRLLADGRPDPAFHGDGVRGLVPSTGSAARCATVVQPDGKIVAALRTARTARTGFDVELVRIRPGGSIDTSFGRRGRTTIDLFRSDDAPAAMLADGAGVTVGTTSAGLGRDHDVALVRVKDDGSIARPFGIDGRIALDVAQTLGGAAGGDRLLDLVPHGNGVAVLGIGARPARVRGVFRLGPHALDGRPPTSRIGHPRDGGTFGQLGVQTVRGAASDRLSGIRRVEIAIRQTLTGGGCRWLAARGGFVNRACDRPVWHGTDGSVSWSFELPRVLPESRGSIKAYRAYARATDGARNVERRFQPGRNVTTFEVRN